MKQLFLTVFAFLILQLSVHAQKSITYVNKVGLIHKGQKKGGKGLRHMNKSDFNKKDGTPDMRFKVNQQNSVGPKKADGTLDLRFKQNKKPVKKN